MRGRPKWSPNENKSDNRRWPKTLALGVYLALGVGLVLHLLHVGQHEAHEVGALFHWLRDSVLAIPLAVVAVALGALLVDRKEPDNADRVLWALVTSFIYALATIPGNLAHAYLFGAEHAQSGSVVSHLVRDASVALVPAFFLLTVAAFVALLPGERRRSAATRQPQIAAVVFHRPDPLSRRVWMTVLSGAMMMTALSAIPTPIPLPEATPAEAQVGDNRCNREIFADVVAIDQPFVYNRLGAANPNGLIYALRRDVVDKTSGLTEVQGAALTAGNVMLRPDKRPRPLVLRADVGDCITINFQNLLEQPPLPDQVEFPNGDAPGFSPANGQFEEWPTDRHVGIHVNGMQLVDSINDDGSFVGQNGLDEFGAVLDTSGLAAPGESKVYTLFAEYENGYLMYNLGATVGSEGTGGTTGLGLFGAINVEPVTSEWYRSQLTREEMDMAASAWVCTLCDGTDWTGPSAGNLPQGTPGAWNVRTTPDGQPILNYNAVYPTTDPPGPKDGLPIISMLAPKTGFAGEVVHSDLNAIISGPALGVDGVPGNGDEYKIPKEAYAAGYWENANYPGGDDPFREFTVIFEDEAFAVQAFPQFNQFNDPVLAHTLQGVQDAFPINYGTGGIGAEIIANRVGLGPMANCVECKYEEFFLTAWTVGDPAMVVDVPANVNVNGDGSVVPNPLRATRALYPDDPSNVHHSYLNDRVKFRNLHAGVKEHHIFHLHAHQWQYDWNSETSTYLDSQGIGPGASFTYDIAYGGSGNRNKTAGDSIFHCHFYPHFAMGMWELWRSHDTFERGTRLNGDGTVADGARALPDGEIVAGTPIPGVVPLPSIPMAPSPATEATLVTGWDDPNDPNDIPTSQIDLDQDSTPDILQTTAVDLDFNNDAATDGADSPGYPFFIAGLAGHRPPTPVLDMVDTNGDGVVEDGGLPRHIITTAPAVGTHTQHQTRLDFNKELENVGYGVIPEAGTAAEIVAMDFHEERWHDTYLPDGRRVDADGTIDPDEVAVTRRLGESDGGAVGPDASDPTLTLEGFETNGLPPQHGAPYAEPCRTDPDPTTGAVLPVTETRRYKGANIQMDITLNKVGWHFQQQRFEALWEDVGPMLTEAKAPEPLVMRLNPTECAEFWHTNLVPNVYELDDYQVKTPTDIIGQHIHLVKFDVTSADGSANGWNYEDGTLSPQEVEERIHAISNNAAANGGCGEGFVDVNGDRRLDVNDFATAACPLAVAHPYFKNVPGVGDLAWGARTTAQRWYADPLLSQSWDRGLGTVFTHDHYGPSTHQQVGLYSTVLVEPMGSTWRDPETGETMGGVFDGSGDDTLYVPETGPQFLPGETSQVTASDTVARQDGGPTSWRADILTPDPANSHREFFMEFADFQHAYEAGQGALTQVDNGDGVLINSYADFFNAVNPSVRQEPPANRLADLFWFPNQCPGSVPGNVVPRPCPEAISADDPGTYVVNYRNEPIGLRVFDPDKTVIDPDTGLPVAAPGQTAGEAGDLARAFETRTDRAIADLNTTQGQIPYPALTGGVLPGDPATPLARVYMGDKVRFRVQTGAHEEEHNMTIHGLKWRQEEHGADSGWRNSQFMGISEYFNIEMPVVPDIGSGNPATLDYMWTMGAQTEDLWNGVWGILRSYGRARADLLPLPNNDFSANGTPTITNIGEFTPPKRGRGNPQPRVCPNIAPERFIRVTAVRAADVLGPDGLVYNTRTNGVTDPTTGLEQGAGPLIDPTALMYVRNEDLTYDGDGNPNGLKPGVPVEPLILRANAGDCVEVELTNALPTVVPNLPGFSALPPIVAKDKNVLNNGVQGITTFNANDLTPSSLVGLHAQLVEYNVRDSDGFLTGTQSDAQLVPPGASKKYTWYAGDIGVTNNPDGSVTLVATPVEFGVVNLMPADRITGSNKGLVGALVIEPEDATWIEDADSRASATVFKKWNDGTDTAFREFVTVLQTDVNLRYGGGCPGVGTAMDCAVPNVAAEGGGVPEDPQDSGQKGINYGTEPLWFRLGIAPNTPFEHANLRGATQFDVFSNSLPLLGAPTPTSVGDPQTPVFTVSTEPFTDVDGDGNADAMQFRMRVVQPGGHARGIVMTINGHAWQREPYVNGSADIGDDFRTHNHLDLSASTHNANRHNMRSWWTGAQEGIGASSHFDFVPRKTGGTFAVPGDYLFSDIGSFGRFQGLWGIVRFADPADNPNLPPTAVDDGFDANAWTRRNPQRTNVSAPGVLANDSDPEGDPMTAELVSDATHGTVTLNADGSFTYLPTDGRNAFFGEDTFTYQVTSPGAVSNIATVTLDVK